MVDWQPIKSYPGGMALFWCSDCIGGYAVFGEVDHYPDDEPRIWDDEGRGYATLDHVTHWAACEKPRSPHLH